MCGIVGYVGERDAVEVILDGLRRLEYRGYDSAGLAVVDSAGNLRLRRASGKIRNLEDALRVDRPEGSCGVGHTRWATHGRPTEENAHPHRDCKGDVVVVHNGIIENYLELKHALQQRGHRFESETDTEVIAHLVEEKLELGVERAVREAVKSLRGLFALAVLSRRQPDKIVAVRMGPPVVIGLGPGEYFVASDVPALLSYTRDVFFLADGDVAVVTRQGVRLVNFEGEPVKREITHIQWDPILAEKGGYKHFMLKEIYEQPRAVRDTIVGRLDVEHGQVYLDEIGISEEEFTGFASLKIVACGTSWHAALAGKFMIERLARIPVEVDYGSEFRYRDPLVGPESLTVLISQSGETADTLAAARQAKERGSKTLAICNVPGSMLTREAHGTILTHAGPEIGVASTKAFTTQLAALFLLALYLGRIRGVLSQEQCRLHQQELLAIPARLETLLTRAVPYEELAARYSKMSDFLYLGRGIHYPIALEGALKLKEISYIHAEGYPAGEMKHGPIALIDEQMPVVVVATRDARAPWGQVVYEKTLGNMQEVKARRGTLIAVVVDGDRQAAALADQVIEVPPAPDLLLPILEVVPLQLLAYHIAVTRGCDVDQPRNLAKSVTVE